MQEESNSPTPEQFNTRISSLTHPLTQTEQKDSLEYMIGGAIGEKFKTALKGTVVNGVATNGFQLREFARSNPHEAWQILETSKQVSGEPQPDLVKAMYWNEVMKRDPASLVIKEDPAFRSLEYTLEYDSDYEKIIKELVAQTTAAQDSSIHYTDQSLLTSEAYRLFKERFPDKAQLYAKREQSRIYQDPDGLVNPDLDPAFPKQLHPWDEEEKLKSFAAKYPEKATIYAKVFPLLQSYITEQNSNSKEQISYEYKLNELRKNDNEVLIAFEKAGYPLNWQLVEMLNEGKDHQGGRRGSGFTQATRHLAEYIRHPRSDRDIDIFDTRVKDRIYDYLDSLAENRGELKPFDLHSQIDRDRLQSLLSTVSTEEAQLITKMILDITFGSSDNLKQLPAVKEKLQIGTCTTAETYFLEYGATPMTELGTLGKAMNIIVDSENNPLIIEKVGLGEDHSGITLQPMILNGVTIPPGSLIGVQYPETIVKSPFSDNSGSRISLSDCVGFEFLRLTTLAISPEHRERAFKTHYQFQNHNKMVGYDTLSISDLMKKAQTKVGT